MPIYSTSVSVHGLIADREGAFGGRPLTRSSFVSSLAQTRELGGHERSVDLAVQAGMVKRSGAFFAYGWERLGRGRAKAKTLLEERPGSNPRPPD